MASTTEGFVFFWKSYFDHLMTKGSNFDNNMRLINHAKYTIEAMARVWRDGQKRKVHIYRLITTGTIEEKIFQRQISKQGLNSVVDFDNTQIKGNSSVKFSIEELKDLFTLCQDTSCETHDLLNCRCGDNELDETQETFTAASSIESTVPKNASMDELFYWQHFSEPIDQSPLCDETLLEASNCITFVFQNETSSTND